ncbi:LysR family transcriptional regulator [Myxococcaceae bacterium JPH2]|nr:LysR family transcriptional regulator [Myxococcaceae bacterium JPH2]
MNHEWLHAFVVFAEHLNFTRAAERLNISQPAVHVQIRKLSEAVGRPLYQRVGRTLVLTREGRRLAAHGREALERDQGVLQELRGEAHSGPVILCAGQGAFLYLLGPVIRQFPKERWPLRLLALPGPETLAHIRESRAHLGVVAGAVSPENLVVEPLRTVGQRVVVPSSHRHARRRTLKPEELEGEQLVVAPEGSPHRTMLTQLLRGSGCTWRVAVEATGWELMMHFVRLGMGIGVVNDFCPVPRGFVGIPLSGAPPTDYVLVSRPGPQAEGVERLRRLILESVALPTAPR